MAQYFHVDLIFPVMLGFLAYEFMVRVLLGVKLTKSPVALQVSPYLIWLVYIILFGMLYNVVVSSIFSMLGVGNYSFGVAALMGFSFPTSFSLIAEAVTVGWVSKATGVDIKPDTERSDDKGGEGSDVGDREVEDEKDGEERIEELNAEEVGSFEVAAEVVREILGVRRGR